MVEMSLPTFVSLYQNTTNLTVTMDSLNPYSYYRLNITTFNYYIRSPNAKFYGLLVETKREFSFHPMLHAEYLVMFVGRSAV